MARTPRARRAGRPVPRAARAAPALDALLVEGALIAPAQLAAIAAAEAGEQAAADYRLRPGLSLRDEIPLAYRVGQTLFAGLTASPDPSAAATAAFTWALMRDVFGFPDGAADAAPGAALGGRVPVVVVPPADGLDSASAALSAAAGRRTSAALALQDRLNGDDGALWGLACNGLRLRLMRDNPSLTRPAYIEADLRRIFEADALSDFSALWLLLHASRFGQPGTPPADCALERWRDAGQKVGETARERLREGVEKALALIGDGLLRHPANAALRDCLRGGDLPLPEFFNQLLQLAYRMIFLLVAEDRGLLHPPAAPAAARALYAGGYSLSRLRARAVQPARDAHDDLWDGLGIVMSALARGEPRLGLPALDGLFAPGGTPDLDGAALSNRALLDAVRGLAWLDGAGGAPVPVNWRDMETEELGSVYEALLELTPRLVDGGRGFAFAEGAETRGNQRKTTGSYYTPDSLVQALLASALDPVLDRVQAEDPGGPTVEHSLTKGEAEVSDPRRVKAVFPPLRPVGDSDLGDSLERAVTLPPPADPAAALLGVRVLDPACGSGHFLLAAGRHIAARVARLRAGGTAGAAEYRHALRDVARVCLYGVDRNPMAVMLAKVALWIETVEPGLPLGFLDANLRCGDALLGVFDLDALRLGIPDAAYKPLAGDDRAACQALARRNRGEREGQGTLDLASGGGRLPPAAPLARATVAWRALPEDSPTDIAAKRAQFEATRAAPDAYALHAACDLYVAAFLSLKPAGAEATPRTSLVPTTAAIWGRATGQMVYGPLEGRAVDLARASRAFHWPLEFPDIIAAGGFDAVLGNPPWDVVQLEEEEYFLQRMPEISALAGAARKAAIAGLALHHPMIFNNYERDKHAFEASNEFARASGRFPLTARGRINTYSLFSELSASIITQQGRAGIIVPTGIATDAQTALFFSEIVRVNKLIALYSFREVREWFPDTDDRNQFSLMTLGLIAKDPVFVFYATKIEHIIERRFAMSKSDIESVNPDTKTAPIFRAPADALVTAKIYRMVAKYPRPLTWIRLKQNVFSSSIADDLREFARAKNDNERVVAVRRGGSFHQYCVAFNLLQSAGGIVIETTSEEEERNEASKFVSLQYFSDRMEKKEIRCAYHLAIRRIARSTDERTMIATMLPMVGTDDTASILIADQSLASECALLANLNSIVLDYSCMQKIGGTDIRKHNFGQLPILHHDSYSSYGLDYIKTRVVELVYTDAALAPFARDVGYAGPPFAWDEARRATLRAELDAWYARAYGLTRDELRYVLDPADTHGPAYPSETFRVLRENEVRRHGEYRTRRLVLDAWDRLDDSSR